MNTVFGVLCLFLVFKAGISQISKRISELKCDEFNTLSTNPQIRYPHLMRFVETEPNGFISYICTGTLISEDFVLTSARCVYIMSFGRSELRVQRLVHEKQRSSPFFTVKRFVENPLFVEMQLVTENDIGLIQLNEIVPYRNDLSYRPACLWGSPDPLPQAFKYSTYTFEPNTTKSELEMRSGVINTNEECSLLLEYHAGKPLHKKITDSNICFNLTDPDLTHVTIIGRFLLGKAMPLDTKIGEQFYIAGVIKDIIPKESRVLIGARVSNSIEWIEQIVWPQTDVEINSKFSNDDLHIGCGLRKIRHKPFITFSRSSYHGEFPWHVALYRNEGGRLNNQKYICGGTIITDKEILTAAHCLSNENGLLPANRVTIVAGTYNLNERSIDAQTYGVKEIMVHDKYNRHYLENDIALLKVNRPIEFSNYIQPICIGNISTFANLTIGTVAGWGYDERNQPTDVLLQATFPIANSFDCRDSNRNFFPTYLNDNNYCAGYQNGTSVCSGDSGGGMIFYYESRWYIRGIVSLGVALPNLESRCDVTQLVLFTDVPKFYDWIVNNSATNV